MTIKTKKWDGKNITYYMVNGTIASRAIWGIHEKGVMFLDGIHTAPAYENQGYGTKILQYLKTKTDTIILFVAKLDNKTINFYTKNGFVIRGRQAVWQKYTAGIQAMG